VTRARSRVIEKTLAAVAALAVTAVGAMASPLAYVPSSSTGDVWIVDTATDAVTNIVPTGATFIQSAVVSPDGGTVYIGSLNDTGVLVLDAVSETLEPNIPTTSPIGHTSLALNPAGTRLYAANVGITVIDTVSKTEVTTITHPDIDNPNNLAVTPDGSKLYVVNAFGGDIVVISTASNTVLTSIPGGGNLRGVDFHPDGSKAYVSDDVSAVRVISTATDTQLTSIPTASVPLGIRVHPDGSLVYASTGTGLTVIDTATNLVVTNVPFGGTNFGLDITPDGSKLYVGSVATSEVFFVDTATNTVIDSMPIADPFARGKFIGPVLVCGDGNLQPGEECDDGGVVPGDGCDAACQMEPCFAFAPCATAAGTSISVKDSTPDSKDQVSWKWKKGTIDAVDLGDPLTTTDYELCILDDGVPVTGLLFTIPAGLTCDGGKDCWKMLGQLPTPKGYKYKNKATSSEGVSDLSMKAGVGKASLGFKAKSVQLSLPGPVLPTQYFNQMSSVTVRLRRLDGIQCWESVFTTSSKNTAEQFSAKAP
jgi:cysteine-rich repeat protein/YVTN family beta-propeller protein